MWGFCIFLEILDFWQQISLIIYFKRCLLKISCSRGLVKPIIISCYRFYISYDPKGSDNENLYVRCESVEWGIT